MKMWKWKMCFAHKFFSNWAQTLQDCDVHGEHLTANATHDCSVYAREIINIHVIYKHTNSFCFGINNSFQTLSDDQIDLAVLIHTSSCWPWPNPKVTGESINNAPPPPKYFPVSESQLSEKVAFFSLYYNVQAVVLWSVASISLIGILWVLAW